MYYAMELIRTYFLASVLLCTALGQVDSLPTCGTQTLPSEFEIARTESCSSASDASDTITFIIAYCLELTDFDSGGYFTSTISAPGTTTSTPPPSSVSIPSSTLSTSKVQDTTTPVPPESSSSSSAPTSSAVRISPQQIRNPVSKLAITFIWARDTTTKSPRSSGTSSTPTSSTVLLLWHHDPNPRFETNPGVPELGPGLRPEMEVEERPGELDGKLTKDIKDSILFWRKDKYHGIIGLIGAEQTSHLWWNTSADKNFATADERQVIWTHLNGPK
ncbi:hypothetical protein DL95DRAFT_399937 [Leptodontidium sp. 2 PMI_412]|nr:hypothetical protein DL95DRAFT_399937 [Leptodontidium sp. 2 PMI_412]